MLSISCFPLLFFLIGTTLFFSPTMCDTNARDLIILTDMEPEDRIALNIVSARLELSERLLFVGTTLLNTELKAALARRQLEQSGLGHVPVYAGTGGPPSSYPNDVETAKAALNFWHEEGNGILKDEELKKYREIDPEEEIYSDPEETIARMIRIEDVWSIIIKGLPESKDPNKNRYQEDYQTVIKLLDMLNMTIPPKIVYRMAKPRGILTIAPHPLKVYFTVGFAAPFIMTEWQQNYECIRRKMKLPRLEFHSGMSESDFKKAKGLFFNNAKNSQQAEPGDDDFEYFDANDKFKKNKKKKERFYDPREYFEQDAVNIDHQTDGERTKISRDEASSLLADIDLQEVRKFLVKEERERSVIMKSIPEYTPIDASNDAGAGKEGIPPPLPLPSQLYNWDYEAVMDVLYAMGVEVYPLAVRRLGHQADARGRRHLQVIFRSKKVVEIVLLSWKTLGPSIRWDRRDGWGWLVIKKFETDVTDLTGNKIKNKEQLSDMLGYLSDTSADHADNQSDKKDKGKEMINSSKIIRGSHNELQNALIKTLSKAEENSIEILLMTASIDLVQVLDAKPELAKAIRRVHLMGGWVPYEAPLHLQQPSAYYGKKQQQKQVNKQPPPTIWGNYNLNMAPESTKRLFAMASNGHLPLRLYTYRHVWEIFQGSVNKTKFPGAIKAINDSTSPVLKEFRIAAKSWDEHAMKVMPYLTRFIGPYAGEQFSPADPILVVGLLNPESFIEERRRIKVNVKHEELEALNDVLEVQIEYDMPNSNIELIIGLDERVFEKELGRSLGVESNGDEGGDGGGDSGADAGRRVDGQGGRGDGQGGRGGEEGRGDDKTRGWDRRLGSGGPRDGYPTRQPPRKRNHQQNGERRQGRQEKRENRQGIIGVGRRGEQGSDAAGRGGGINVEGNQSRRKHFTLDDKDQFPELLADRKNMKNGRRK